jgi:hypothetical protein
MTEYTEPKRPEEMTRDELVARVHCLERGIMPFAKIALGMMDARIRLDAEGRNEEPAGGHWVNNLRSSAMSKSEVYFFSAFEIRGRADTEADFMRDMERLATLTKASQEKASTVDRTDH